VYSEDGVLTRKMGLTEMAYKLMRVFEEKYTALLERRQKISKKKISLLTLYALTIRVIQSAIITGKSMAGLISVRVGKWVPG